MHLKKRGEEIAISEWGEKRITSSPRCSKSRTRGGGTGNKRQGDSTRSPDMRTAPPDTYQRILGEKKEGKGERACSIQKKNKRGSPLEATEKRASWRKRPPMRESKRVEEGTDCCQGGRGLRKGTLTRNSNFGSQGEGDANQGAKMKVCYV